MAGWWVWKGLTKAADSLSAPPSFSIAIDEQFLDLIKALDSFFLTAALGDFDERIKLVRSTRYRRRCRRCCRRLHRRLGVPGRHNPVFPARRVPICVIQIADETVSPRNQVLFTMHYFGVDIKTCRSLVSSLPQIIHYRSKLSSLIKFGYEVTRIFLTFV